MDKRFTLKDFFLFTAIGAVLVALLVAMYMIDRQTHAMPSRGRRICRITLR